MENYILYIVSGLVIVFGAILIYFAYKYPAKVKKWLVYAVTVAEKQLGSGTGQLKLRTVYDMFMTKFPKLSIFIGFDTFSGWVDIALEEMNKLLENPAVKNYVES